MRRSFLTFAAATAVLALTSQSQAAPIAPEGIGAALDNTAITENVQFVWRGASYCWYDGGWHGPGWYRCGFQFRRGFGWGGGIGWNNWERGRRFGGERFEHRGGRASASSTVRAAAIAATAWDAAPWVVAVPPPAPAAAIWAVAAWVDRAAVAATRVRPAAVASAAAPWVAAAVVPAAAAVGAAVAVAVRPAAAASAVTNRYRRSILAGARHGRAPVLVARRWSDNGLSSRSVFPLRCSAAFRARLFNASRVDVRRGILRSTEHVMSIAVQEVSASRPQPAAYEPPVAPQIRSLFFEDLSVGMSETLSRVLSSTDVLDFAELTGDHNPIHVSDDYAAQTMFKTRIAHGLFTASLISTVLGTRLPGPGAIYISQSLNFRAPVKIGDRVEVAVVVAELMPEKRRARLACTCMVGDEVVLDGEAWVKVPSKYPPPPKS